jgi:CRISPR-associated protein Csc1
MSFDDRPSLAHIYRLEILLWEHTFFSSREISAFFQTEPLIGNYALTYALGLASSPYRVKADEKSGKQTVSYKHDLNPLNERGIYVTPATILGEAKFALTQFNAQTDAYWSAFAQNSIVTRQDHESIRFNGQNWQQLDPITGEWRKSPRSKPVNYPQHGRIKMLALGNLAVSYVISREPLDAFLPRYIRLGKFMSKAEVKVLHLFSQSEHKTNLTFNGFLNPADLPDKKSLRMFDMVSIHPVPLIKNAQLSGWFYQASDNVWIPAGMKFGVEGLPS